MAFMLCEVHVHTCAGETHESHVHTHTLTVCLRAGCVSRAARGAVLDASSLAVPWGENCRTRRRPQTRPGQKHGSVNTHTHTLEMNSVLNERFFPMIPLTVCVCFSEACKKDVSCDYFFSIDSDVALINPDILRILIEENK